MARPALDSIVRSFCWRAAASWFPKMNSDSAYEEIARVAGEHGAVIRLFDLGGDNLRAQQFQEPEKNPALGLARHSFCVTQRRRHARRRCALSCVLPRRAG